MTEHDKSNEGHPYQNAYFCHRHLSFLLLLLSLFSLFHLQLHSLNLNLYLHCDVFNFRTLLFLFSFPGSSDHNFKEKDGDGEQEEGESDWPECDFVHPKACNPKGRQDKALLQKVLPVINSKDVSNCVLFEPAHRNHFQGGLL